MFILHTWLAILTCQLDLWVWPAIQTHYNGFLAWLCTMSCHPDSQPWIATLIFYPTLLTWLATVTCNWWSDMLFYPATQATVTCSPHLLLWHVSLHDSLLLTCHPDLLFWPTFMNFPTRVDVLAHWSNLSPWSASLSYLLTWLAIQTNSGTNYPHLLPIQCTCSSNFLSWLATLTCHPFCYVAL